MIGHPLLSFTSGVTVTPAPTVAGGYGRTKKRRVILEGKRLMLTEEEIRDLLLTKLEPKPVAVEADSPAEEKAEAKPKKKARKATYPALPAFDPLWHYFIQTRQVEVAAILRDIAQREQERIEEDDISTLLLLHG